MLLSKNILRSDPQVRFPAACVAGSLSKVARGEPVVGVPGIEPGTSSLSGTRSNQLSYTPISDSTPFTWPLYEELVEAAGFEPAASSLQSWRSAN